MTKAVLLCLVVGAVAASAGLAASRPAHLTVVSISPFAVQGSGFKAHERVTVTVVASGARTKRMLAGAQGGFKASFTGFSVKRCTAYLVRATGSDGSTAVLKVIPECAPQGAQNAADPLFPSDPGAPKKPH